MIYTNTYKILISVHLNIYLMYQVTFKLKYSVKIEHQAYHSQAP